MHSLLRKHRIFPLPKPAGNDGHISHLVPADLPSSVGTAVPSVGTAALPVLGVIPASLPSTRKLQTRLAELIQTLPSDQHLLQEAWLWEMHTESSCAQLLCAPSLPVSQDGHSSKGQHRTPGFVTL